MSAPESVDPEGYTDIGCGCGRLYSYGGHVEPGQHDQDCPVSLSLALARLQARWDARDTALRALVARWRAAAADLETEAMNRAIAGRITVLEACADELERAMEDGRG